MESSCNVEIFYSRHIPDGSWNLICPKCLLPVATAKDKSALSRVKHGHDCLRTFTYSWRDLINLSRWLARPRQFAPACRPWPQQLHSAELVLPVY